MVAKYWWILYVNGAFLPCNRSKMNEDPVAQKPNMTNNSALVGHLAVLLNSELQFRIARGSFWIFIQSFIRFYYFFSLFVELLNSSMTHMSITTRKKPPADVRMVFINNE